MNRILEIVVDSVESAKIAADNGADRLELCDNLSEGGITPSWAKIERVVKKVKIPVHVLVRPRKGDFLYSKDEFIIMKKDISSIAAIGAAGVVTGVLTEQGEVDVLRTAHLMDAASGMDFTFHRAFDNAADHFAALDALIELGVNRVLTSGGKPTAMEGAELIEQLINRAAGRITVMAGSGVLPHNLEHLMRVKGLNDFHSSAKTLVQSAMKYRGGATMGAADLDTEFQWYSVNAELVRKMRALLNQ